jgi:hypothetical protein
MMPVYMLAVLRVLLHLLTNHNYGFHRDELATLDDARFLAWGYVAYPPLTPAAGRLAMEIFGLSTNSVRLFGALAQAASIVLTADLCRRLGGGRFAQFLAALCVAVSPLSLIAGALFQYVTFDYLWWVLAMWCLARLLAGGDPRWWLGVGTAIGLGMLTRYTMGVLVIGLLVAVVATPARRFLRSPWLYAGALIAIAMALPNLIWQYRHDFVWFDFLKSIHERDISLGRTDGFLLHQFFVPAHALSVPVWLAGLWFLLRAPAGRDFRLFGWWWITVLAVFALAQARDYYMAPAYPVLLAAGAVAAEKWSPRWRPYGLAGLSLGGLAVAAIALPAAPPGSRWFQVATGINGDLREQIGWDELVETVSNAYQTLPDAERAQTGILAGNYGEAGAINLFGPAHGLPPAISGVNSHYLRGYATPPPSTLLALGFSRATLERHFSSVEFVAPITNRLGVKNEESSLPGLFLCRGMRKPWPEFWKRFRYFG